MTEKPANSKEIDLFEKYNSFAQKEGGLNKSENGLFLKGLKLDLSEICGKSCIHCIYKKRHKTGQFMTLEMVKKIVAQMIKEGINIPVLDLMTSGESLLNPEFPEILAYLCQVMKKEKIFSVLRLNTGLSEPFERLETVLEMGEKGHNISIGFSIDAASYDCYKRIKGGELDRLKDSIIRFLQKRRALRLEYRIFVDLLFLITPENHHEAMPFLNFWRKELAGLQYRVHFPDMPGPLGARTGILFQPAAGKDKGKQEQLNQLYFETMTKISAFAHYHHKLYLPLPDGSVQEFCVNMEKDQLFKLNLGILPLPRDLRPPCSSAIEGPFSISPQGDIRICTHYLSDDGILGNINQGFLQVITGTKGSGFLQNFMDGIFENHCDYCIFPEYSDFEGHWVPPYDLAGARYYWWRYKMYKTALAAFLFAEKKSIPDPNIPMAINILKKALEKS